MRIDSKMDLPGEYCVSNHAQLLMALLVIFEPPIGRLAFPAENHERSGNQSRTHCRRAGSGASLLVL
jgi:hypothetical protein